MVLTFLVNQWNEFKTASIKEENHVNGLNMMEFYSDINVGGKWTNIYLE